MGIQIRSSAKETKGHAKLVSRVLTIFKTISTATASRDLAHGVKRGILVMEGEKSLALYRFKS